MIAMLRFAFRHPWLTLAAIFNADESHEVSF